MTERTFSKERYRIVNGVRLLEIRVRSTLQLFDARDPAPFRARDLDDDFTEYIMASAEELTSQGPMKILIQIQEPERSDLNASEIVDSIRAFFQYQIDLRRLQLTKLFKTVRLFLAIGLVFLVVCLALSKFIQKTAAEDNAFASILREGLIILGWVSMWRPFEAILFDWFPAFDRIRLLKKLLETEIEVSFAKA